MTIEPEARPASRRKKTRARPDAGVTRTATAAPAAGPPPDPPPQPRAPRERLNLAKAAAFSSDVRTLAVNVTVLLIILLIVPVVLTQFLRSEVLIDPIAIPESMQDGGLTSEIAGRRLWDGLAEVKEIAGTAKGTINAIPDSQQVDFSIPDSGLSIDSLIHYVRRFFNIYETHVGGEFRCTDATCSPEGMALRLRIVTDRLEVRQLPPIGTMDENAYFRLAASEVMSVLDPFTAIAARSGTEPGRAKALAYQLVAARHSDAKWAHNLIGNLLLNEGKTDDAIAEYRAALALDPKFDLARTNLGNALRIGNDRAGAREAYATVYSADPRNALAIQGLAALELLDGKPDQAIGLLLEAAAADPLQPAYHVRAANIERDRGNPDQALAYWRKALEIDPSSQGALANMALFFYGNAQFSEAEKLYGAAADYAPHDPAMLAEHADVLILTQNFRRAAERAEQAIKLAPHVARYHILKGWALTNLDRAAEALAAFAAAEVIEPANPDIPYRMASAYEKLGRLEDAIAAYRRFIALTPDPQLAMVAEAYIALFEARIAQDSAPLGATTDAAPEVS